MPFDVCYLLFRCSLFVVDLIVGGCSLLVLIVCCVLVCVLCVACDWLVVACCLFIGVRCYCRLFIVCC